MNVVMSMSKSQDSTGRVCHKEQFVIMSIADKLFCHVKVAVKMFD